jgi:AcrR family transcriptional regulator
LRRILQAARALLEWRGNVLVMEVASRAKVGTATIYHYFTNMDELREAIESERDIDAIIEDVEPGLTTVGAHQ